MPWNIVVSYEITQWWCRWNITLQHFAVPDFKPIQALPSAAMKNRPLHQKTRLALRRFADTSSVLPSSPVSTPENL
jgi:hypothetical protein